MNIDYGGVILYGAGQFLILLALGMCTSAFIFCRQPTNSLRAWGGAAYSWTSAHVLTTLILGCVLLIAFGFYEVYMPLKQPLLPIRILKNRNYIAITIAGSVGQMVFVALSILWPQQIAALYTTDNVKIGWMSVSASIAGDTISIWGIRRRLTRPQCTSGLALAIGEIIMGPLLKAVGHAKWQLIFSSVCLTAFLGAMAATSQSTQGMALAVSIQL